MRYILLYSVLFLLVSLKPSEAQLNACDSLDIINIEYAPFADTMISVYVRNYSSDIFSYPGFILFDANGDTVAKETVNYFGIGNYEQVHMLKIKNGVTVQENFNGTLELWTNFYSNFACSYSVTANLCPDTTCKKMYLSLGNFGGAIAIENFTWEIKNLSGTVLYNGAMTLDANQQQDVDSICLPFGNYVVEISSATQPAGQVYFSTYVGNQFISGPGGPYINSGILVNLDFFEACSGTNAINLPNPFEPIQAFVKDEVLYISNYTGKAIGNIFIYDSVGRLILRDESVYSKKQIDLRKYPSVGFYLLNINHKNLSYSKKFVK